MGYDKFSGGGQEGGGQYFCLNFSLSLSSTETVGQVVEEIAEAAGLDPGLPAKVLLARDNRYIHMCSEMMRTNIVPQLGTLTKYLYIAHRGKANNRV